jgi:alpha-galactosidase/6-phospho-beta-glucosidase family protein
VLYERFLKRFCGICDGPHNVTFRYARVLNSER